MLILQTAGALRLPLNVHASARHIYSLAPSCVQGKALYYQQVTNLEQLDDVLHSWHVLRSSLLKHVSKYTNLCQPVMSWGKIELLSGSNAKKRCSGTIQEEPADGLQLNGKAGNGIGAFYV